MITCSKRQHILTNSVESFRCINRASDIFGQTVDSDTCKNCSYNLGTTKKYRWKINCPRLVQLNKKSGRCMGTGHLVTEKECHICQYELVKYGLVDKDGNIIPDTEIKNLKGTLLEEGEFSQDKDKQYPSLLTQANNYRGAVKRWIKAGRPKRTDEEIKEIYERHCEQCNWFDKESNRCKGCGCRVVMKGLAIFNKLRMATEHCPKQLF